MLEVFEQAAQASESISDEWSQIWQDVLIGSEAVSGQYLFAIMSYLGLVAATGTLIFLALHYQKVLLQGNYQDYFANLLIPFIVVLLLSNNGKLLADFCFASRGLINDVNAQVLDFAVAGTSLEEKFAELQQLSGMRVVMSERLQQCEYLVGDEQLTCLQEELTKLKQELGSSGDSKWQKFLDGYVEHMESGLAEYDNGLLVPFKILELGITYFLPSYESITFSVLSGWMQGYQHFLEASLLITTMVAPLAVGGSLLPIGTRSMFAWAIGFFSIGFAKLTFNLMAGLTATATVNNITVVDDQIPLYVVFGFFAPVFSSALSAGGGMAVWSAITGAIEQAMNTTMTAIDLVT